MAFAVKAKAENNLLIDSCFLDASELSYFLYFVSRKETIKVKLSKCDVFEDQDMFHLQIELPLVEAKVGEHFYKIKTTVFYFPRGSV